MNGGVGSSLLGVCREMEELDLTCLECVSEWGSWV